MNGGKLRLKTLKNYALLPNKIVFAALSVGERPVSGYFSFFHKIILEKIFFKNI